jgi:non-heme chloroperoxidase
MSWPIQAARLAGGLRLPYVEQGVRGGVPVLLLHGATDSWRSFEPLLALLPPALHVFALTQRGHGGADGAVSLRGADFADDIVAFMDALRLDRAVLVGHSMGASNAMRCAQRHPARVLALVLESAFYDLADNPVLADFHCTAITALADPIAPEFVRDFQSTCVARPVSAALLDTMVAESLKVPAGVWRALFGGFMAGDFAVDHAAIRAPTLILWGDQDAFAPRADQERLRVAITGARWSCHTGSGHSLHWEEPARFAGAVVDFIRRVTTCPQREYTA